MNMQKQRQIQGMPVITTFCPRIQVGRALLPLLLECQTLGNTQRRPGRMHWDAGAGHHHSLAHSEGQATAGERVVSADG
jgi:hypothetical protein